MTEEELEGVVPEILPKNELTIMVTESNLEPAKAQFIIEKFTEHFKMAAEWAKKAKTIIVTDESQTVNMKMARTGRLFLREKRLEIESARKLLKEQSLRECQAIDRVAGFLKDLIIPTELHLERQEKFVEFRDAAEKERVRLEVEKRMALEAEAKAKADAEEMARLRKEAAEHEKILAEERRKAREAQIESDRIQTEAYDRLRKETEIKMAKERAEREKAESELREKRQAEMRAESAKIKEEERLKKAGDVEKLIKLREDIQNINLPEVKSHESKRILEEIKGYLYLAVSKIKVTVQEEEV